MNSDERKSLKYGIVQGASMIVLGHLLQARAGTKGLPDLLGSDQYRSKDLSELADLAIEASSCLADKLLDIYPTLESPKAEIVDSGANLEGSAENKEDKAG